MISNDPGIVQGAFDGFRGDVAVVVFDCFDNDAAGLFFSHCLELRAGQDAHQNGRLSGSRGTRQGLHRLHANGAAAGQTGELNAVIHRLLQRAELPGCFGGHNGFTLGNPPF